MLLRKIQINVIKRRCLSINPASRIKSCVARNPPRRDESVVQASQVSLSRVYEIMVNVPLFFSHFYIRNQCAARKTPRSWSWYRSFHSQRREPLRLSPPAPSRLSTCLRISGLWYEGSIKKEYGSKLWRHGAQRNQYAGKFSRAKGAHGTPRVLAWEFSALT